MDLFQTASMRAILGFDAARGSSTNSYLPWKKKLQCLIPRSILFFSTKRSFIIAMASPLRINVYDLLPLAVEPGANLDLNPVNSAWVHCLPLPLETLNAVHLSRRPYRWIFYDIGVVAIISFCITVKDFSASTTTESMAADMSRWPDLSFEVPDFLPRH